MGHRDAPRIAGEAAVVGAGMAGLLAARVLTEHVGRVTVVERDRLPAGPAFRRGIPQARHVHILLARGLAALEELFPGFGDELLAAGAVPVRWPADVLWLTRAGWCGRFSEGFRVLCLSRELLEWHVRRRVEALPGVRFLDGHEATGLVASADRRAVAGVRVRARAGAGAATATTAEVPAALVVDASGRDSRVPRWLEELGYVPPAEATVDALLGYASRLYAVPTGFAADWRLLVLQDPPPATPRGGVLFPLEGGRWLATLSGIGDDRPPTDEAGFLAFATSLRSPLLAEAIAGAAPLSPVFGYRRTENRRRRFERLERLPAGFLVTGDAACALNPVYGQGMTVAALEALVLDRCLRAGDGDGLAGLGRRFHRAAARSANAAWLTATGEDGRYPTTGGGGPGPAARLAHRYFDRVLAAATADPAVNLAFLNVLQLAAPPATLVRPRVLLPALLRGGRAAEAGPSPAAPAPDEPPVTGRASAG